MRSSNSPLDRYQSKRIAIISGGCSSEREVSKRSGANVKQALASMGLHYIELDPISPDFFNEPFDIAFNCLHGKWGEDGGLQGYCEMRGIPYTGPGILATSIGFNKRLFKDTMSHLNIPVPALVSSPDAWPFIAKPISEGSSIGVSLVQSPDDWHQLAPLSFNDPNYLFEEYIAGQEITSGVLTIHGEVTVLPILEIKTQNTFYDYDGKYTPGRSSLVCPANISTSLRNEIEAISKKIYDYFNCKGCIRIDMMIDQTGPKVLEMNTNPGLTELSDIPAQAATMGLSFTDLMWHYLDSAI